MHTPRVSREAVRHEVEHGLGVIDAFTWVLHVWALDDDNLLLLEVDTRNWAHPHPRGVTVTETIVRPETRRQVLDAATGHVDHEFVDRTPALRIRVDLDPDADVKIRNTDLELRLELVGTYLDAHGEPTEVRWKSQLTPRQHEMRPYDKTSPTTCALEMTCLDGLHRATSSYTYAPRFWTGLEVQISSVAMERVLPRRRG
jgi:hypothetical protein